MKKRGSRKLAKVIERGTEQYFPSPIDSKSKSKKCRKHYYSTVSKEKSALRKRAEEFDVLVHSILDKQTSKHSDQVLIFTYQNGFVETDLHNFGKYSVKCN